MENIQSATSQDQLHEVAEYHDQIRKIELEGYELVVKKARTALFWAGGLIVFWELVGIFREGGSPDPIGMGIMLAIAGTFVGLALWTKKKPYTAIILGLVAFLAHWLFAIIINGYLYGGEGILKGIIGGIIIRIFILVALIRPLKDAKELQRAREENKFSQ